MDGTMIDLERIVVSGTASDMGEQYGEAARDKIVQFINVRMDAVNQYAADRGRASANGILDVGARSLSLYQEWDPEGYEEHMGIARGANVDAVLLYTSTNMTDMRDALLLRDGAQLPPDNEGCSAILIPQHMTRAGQAIVGQTWDLNPPDIDYVLAVHRKPLTGPQTWTVTCAGCLTLVGMNSHGISVGTTNIKTYGSRAGVGYLSILHKMIRARTVDEASQALEGAPRSGAHVYWVADDTDLREYETNPDSHALRRAQDKAICHTNHCLHEDNIERQAEPCSTSSAARLRKIEQLLDRTDHDIETVKAIFADRSDGFDSVNRYPEDEQGTATNSVFIAIPERRMAVACRGPADRGQWYDLTFPTSEA